MTILHSAAQADVTPPEALPGFTVGEIAARYEYDPYGGALVASDEVGVENPFRFSTKYYDVQPSTAAAGERGLYYYGYRYYSPRLGRWVNRDPIGEDGGMNILSFALNDPLVWVDPDGAEVQSSQPASSQPTTNPTTQPATVAPCKLDGDYKRLADKYDPTSPAKGAVGDPDVVICVANNTTLTIKCKNFMTCKEETCKLIKADGKDVKKDKGPTPAGEYLIDEVRPHGDDKRDWHNLHPRIEDNSGYYGYNAKTKDKRWQFGFHPGKTSWGCITVDNYDNNKCWSKLEKVISSGKLRYKKQKFVGILYVE